VKRNFGLSHQLQVHISCIFTKQTSKRSRLI